MGRVLLTDASAWPAPATSDALALLPGIDAHPHARAVLGPALPPAGAPSHAYLFHGPPGSGRRALARAFAAALLADGALEAASVRERVGRGCHPDLTWVTPSGANEMLVGDVDEALLAAAARTPFESSRRVFVLDGAHTMSDQVAGRLLKTLEEPPPYVHIILIVHRLQDVLPTIASRCLRVRFDPLPLALIEERLGGEGQSGEKQSGEKQGGDKQGGEEAGGEEAAAAACARLALGDADLARWLHREEDGRALRAGAEAFVRGALHGRTVERRWVALLDVSRAAGQRAGEDLAQRFEQEQDLWDPKERRRRAREALEAQRRVERRERTRALDLSLRLAEAWLRDVWCLALDAPEAVHARDRLPELREDAAGRAPARLREALAAVGAWRARLAVNVAEELALEALAYRLELLLGSPVPG
jgi:DNA polymerase-3 subunit delta'